MSDSRSNNDLRKVSENGTSHAKFASDEDEKRDLEESEEYSEY